MSAPCRNVFRDEVVRTETATPSPNRAHLAKGGSWVLWGSWGCCGVLRFRPATVAYRNQIFVICLTKIAGGRARCNATETATQSPNRGHPAQGGSWVLWGTWGCFGVLRFRPEPASGVWLPKSNFGYLPYDSGKAAARASTPQKPNFRLSNRPFGWPG